MNTTSTDWARLTNARDELAERLSAMRAGGEITCAAEAREAKKVARQYRVKPAELSDELSLGGVLTLALHAHDEVTK